MQTYFQPSELLLCTCKNGFVLVESETVCARMFIILQKVKPHVLTVYLLCEMGVGLWVMGCGDALEISFAY